MHCSSLPKKLYLKKDYLFKIFIDIIIQIRIAILELLSKYTMKFISLNY